MSNKQDEGLTGQCLCGQIRYQVRNIKPRMAHCHCKMCQRFHGAGFATFGEVESKDFTWLAGEEYLASFKAPNGTTRQFCQACGSSLIFVPSGQPNGLVEFTLGTLDQDTPVLPDAHIFTESKANWVDVCDGLPEYARQRN